MNCVDTEHYIQLFVDDKLTGVELREFLDHIEGCPACYEEMEINYLIKEALSRLEDGKTFDLRTELVQKLECSKKCLRLHEKLVLFRQVVMIFTLVTLMMTLVSVMITYGANYLF